MTLLKFVLKTHTNVICKLSIFTFQTSKPVVSPVLSLSPFTFSFLFLLLSLPLPLPLSAAVEAMKSGHLASGKSSESVSMRVIHITLSGRGEANHKFVREFAAYLTIYHARHAEKSTEGDATYAKYANHTNYATRSCLYGNTWNARKSLT